MNDSDRHSLKVKHLLDKRKLYESPFEGEYSGIKNHIRGIYLANIDDMISAEDTKLHMLESNGIKDNLFGRVYIDQLFEDNAPQLAGRDNDHPGYMSWKVYELPAYEDIINLNIKVLQVFNMEWMQTPTVLYYPKIIDTTGVTELKGAYCRDSNYVLPFYTRELDLDGISMGDMFSVISDTIPKLEFKVPLLRRIIPFIYLNDNDFDDVHHCLRLLLVAPLV